MARTRDAQAIIIETQAAASTVLSNNQAMVYSANLRGSGLRESGRGSVSRKPEKAQGCQYPEQAVSALSGQFQQSIDGSRVCTRVYRHEFIVTGRNKPLPSRLAVGTISVAQQARKTFAPWLMGMQRNLQA